LAGLLTYFFRQNAFPISQWQSFVLPTFQKRFVIERSLQQRVCSGFSPDSLFNAFPERDSITKTWGKGTIYFLYIMILRQNNIFSVFVYF
jgi:hypothetical protein